MYVVGWYVAVLSLHNANNENWEDGETMEEKLRLSWEKSFVLHVCLSKIGKVDQNKNFFLASPTILVM